jgi:hypothetical protein
MNTENVPITKRIEDPFIWDLLRFAVPHRLQAEDGTTVEINEHDRTYLLQGPSHDWITDGAGLPGCRFFAGCNWHDHYQPGNPMYIVKQITWGESLTLEVWDHWLHIEATERD